MGPAKGKQKLIINKAGLPSISFLMIFYSLLCFGMNSFDFVSQKKLDVLQEHFESCKEEEELFYFIFK